MTEQRTIEPKLWHPENWQEFDYAMKNASDGDTIVLRAGCRYEHPQWWWRKFFSWRWYWRMLS